MTYKVPEWDDTSNDLLAFDDHAIPFHFKKGGPDVHQFQSQHSYLQQQRYSALRAYSTSALVPIVSDHLPDSVTQPKMQSGDCTKSSDGLECSPICSPNSLVPLTNACAQEDEMLSWLRYPLADSLDRSYCSEVFGELMNPNVQLVKDVFLHQSMKDSENSLVQSAEVSFKSDSGLQESKHISGATSPPRTETKSDAAMALGAGRAAGRLSQIGSEAFNGVRTQITPNSLLKSQSSLLMESVPGGNKTVQLRNPLSASSATSSAFNFSLFSRPLATTMDNLHVLGVASGPTNTQRARQPLAKDLQMPSDPYITDSNRSETISLSSYQQSAECGSQGRGEQSGSTYEDWCSPSNLHCKSYSRRQVEKGDLHSRESCISVSETALDVSEATEAPVSPSYLSGNSSDKVVQEVTTPSKHALPSAQHSEQPDVEDAAANARKPPPAPRSSKRSRAAEVHNESEKKRRNKLNVRLKLLQSLIPNSNKTDKASVLDEAIEYTKMLQAQVQFMSMKTGMFFPTMMHSGMQFVPVEQLPAFSHLGMGMGMGMPVGVNIEMGVGLPLADANVANTIGVGIGVAAGAGAGAGPTTNLSPMSHQERGYAWAGPQRVAKSSCLPIYDSSGSLPIACQPYRVNMAQQPLQPMIPTIAHMNADLYSASRQ